MKEEENKNLNIECNYCLLKLNKQSQYVYDKEGVVKFVRYLTSYINDLEIRIKKLETT